MGGDVPFGRALRQQFGFEPGYVCLNHGSYGSPPNPVRKAMREFSDRVEANPDRFVVQELAPMLARVRAALAELVWARPEEVVVVPNASHGINTVLWNLDWAPNDLILAYNTSYGAVLNACAHICDRNPGVELLVVQLEFPCLHADIVSATERALAAVPEGKRVKLGVVDAIASQPGVRLPWRDICTLLKRNGILSLVDGAHELGQQPIDLSTADCDFYISNAHKWLMSHRGSSLFYVPLRNQHLIRSSFPTSAGYWSKTYPGLARVSEWKFVEQFDWTGTLDYTVFYSILPALEFRRSLGGEAAIQAYCHALALSGGKRMAKLLGEGSGVMENERGELTACMVGVYFPATMPRDTNAAETKAIGPWVDALLFEKNLRIGAGFHRGRWTARCSAQVFNDMSDFEAAARVISEVSVECARRLNEWRAKAVWSADGLDEAHGAVCF